MPQVNATHPLFAGFAILWKQIRDCIEGSATIKAAQPPYLRKPNPLDLSEENSQRFIDYIKGARFHNMTGATLKQMVGQCFAVDPVYTGPDELQFLIDDADGAGVSAIQQSKKALGLVVAYSRAGLFTDYPTIEGVVSIADAEANGIRPKLILLEPWRVINWRTSLKGARSKLSLVVIREDYISEDDGFDTEIEEQFRVLRLENDIYSFEVWRQDGSSFSIVEEGTPTDTNTNPFDEIPFSFIGAECNDTTLEKPLLIDISDLNIGHFQNSADYEESVYMVGQPTPWASGLTDSWVENQLKGQILIGSRAFLPLPDGATCGMMQPEPNTLPKEAMDQKEAQAVALGARLVEKREVAQTATEKSLNEASESSILSGCCANVSAAYRRNLEFAARFHGVEVPEDGILWELNTEFAVSRLTPEQAGAIINLYNAGLITFEECRDKLKSGGFAYLDDDEAKDQMDKQSEDDLMAAKKAMEASGLPDPNNPPA